MEKADIGVIGGSGLYQMEGLENVRQVELTTPFGEPSSPVTLGTLAGKQIAFIARHGFGHTLSPAEVNYRANVYALKMLGISRLLSISAVGSLREEFAPGHIVIPDQLFDHTLKRPRSFFGEGLVVHVGVADPFCAEFSRQVYDAVRDSGGTVHSGAALITIEGPRFSTRAESNAYRSWGLDLIGMTACPEAFLAREAELCYAIMAHVTDYDVWHASEEVVTVEMVIRTLLANTATAQQAVHKLAERVDPQADCACHHALRDALITHPGRISPETRSRLGLLTGKYLID